MKKILLSMFAALCLCAVANAVPAYRGLINYTQPDGSVIQIRLHGDEFCHWVTDASGQVVEMDDEGFYRPASSEALSERVAAGSMRRAKANAARTVNRSLAKAGVASGEKHFLVILVQFSDKSFASSTAQQDFTNLLNQHNYSVNGGTGSARDYYYDNSHGFFTPIFDVYGPVTLSNNMAYYGGNKNGDDQAPEKAVKEGCELVNSQFNVDFNQFDNDNDGEVDLVFMYYAGYGEADGGSTNTIWPHQWDLTSAGTSLTLDGKKIDKYACTNEVVGSGAMQGQMCGIGTACHEFGHAMGLPDFYDTDYDSYNGEAGGLYDFSTMCGGSYNNEGRTPPYFNIEERIMLGWMNANVIEEFPRTGTYILPGINNNIAYKTPTDMNGEYFLYECRSDEGWDAYLPQKGLIVYHVDKSSRPVSIYVYGSGYQNVTAQSLWSNWEQYNSINENGSHPCFTVIPAGAQTNYNYNGTQWAFGVSGRTSFTGTSWNGVESDIQLSNISYSNNQVTLYASVPSTTLNYNVIANPGNGVYTAGSSFALELEQSEAQPVSSVAWFVDDEPVGTSISGGSVVLTAGAHLVEAHITLAGGESKIIELTLEAR